MRYSKTSNRLQEVRELIIIIGIGLLVVLLVILMIDPRFIYEILEPPHSIYDFSTESEVVINNNPEVRLWWQAMDDKNNLDQNLRYEGLKVSIDGNVYSVSTTSRHTSKVKKYVLANGEILLVTKRDFGGSSGNILYSLYKINLETLDFKDISYNPDSKYHQDISFVSCLMPILLPDRRTLRENFINVNNSKCGDLPIEGNEIQNTDLTN